ncbi:unnamed protein product [Enterobius vermicularis]|uniref:Methyltransf_21 domain-containing protein n=1 Tax=Enterobius vermicularis TaxID=51028 RepID=A0A0N4VB12_ENTVE|nr:unnamed protein product [Enterobius vermicularis]
MSKKCKFFGADPIEERNRKIFEPIGKYFKMAVGAISGLKNASVLGYNGNWHYQTVQMQHVDLLTFLKEHVGIKHVIDILLMDNEGAEYDSAPYFLRDGILDSNNIVVCQWTCEFHVTNEANQMKLADFIIKNAAAGKYIMTRLSTAGHIRINFFNTVDKVCLERYWRRCGRSKR